VDDDALTRLLRDDLARQEGVVARRQLEASGAQRHDLQRWVRRRLLTPVHRGVLVDHTGPLTERQRQWAAVLACGPHAALCLLDAPGPVVHVAVDSSRRVSPPPGVRLHRVRGLDQRVRWSASPPRVLPEHDVLLAIDHAVDEDEVVRLLTGAVGSRSTTVTRIRGAIQTLPRLRRRRLVLEVLDDVERGTHSVLERRYLRDVERAHGLPAARWQRRRRLAGRTEYADASYVPQRVAVEIDGRAAHEGWDAENRDGRRDLDQASAGWATVRVRSRQVMRDACETAARLATLLRTRGWTGRPRPCGPGCRVPTPEVAEDSVHPVHRILHDDAG
jgi:very-short-patch-repair endonuclease